MYVLGIDNGTTSGGLFILTLEGEPVAQSPMIHTDSKPKRADERSFCKWLKAHDVNAQNTEVCMEKYHYAQNSSAAFSMADCYATLRTVCKMMGLPVYEVTCHDWQPHFFKKTKGYKGKWCTKEQALKAAKAIWPDWKFPISPIANNIHNGVVDAALIAEFHRRKLTN